MIRTCITAPLLALAYSCISLPAQAAELSLARIFSDHAVLQRDQPITVWGTAGAGRKVTVMLGERAVDGNADARGKWTIQLPPQSAGGPYTLTVAADGQTISRNDILIGDVYLCAGQSNMEFAVRASTNAMGATYGARNDQLRYLNIQKNSAATPQAELKSPVQWTTLTPETVGDASAVCYYMARSLQARYKIPVGFVNASWGGTMIQSWVGAESLRSLSDYREGVDAVAQYGADPAAAMRAEDGRSEAWWRAHDPAAAAQALYEHLELASLFFETELGGEGIFARGA